MDSKSPAALAPAAGTLSNAECETRNAEQSPDSVPPCLCGSNESSLTQAEVTAKAAALMEHLDEIAGHLADEQDRLEKSLRDAFAVTQKDLTAETQRRREN